MTPFADMLTARKGELGEQFGDRFLRSIGWEVFKPGGNGAHSFDRLVVRRTDRSAMIADTKSKPARVKYRDTGIDMRHRDEYLEMSKRLTVECLLVFVDEDAGRVYGDFLSVLERHRRVDIGKEYKTRVLDYPRTEWTRYSDRIEEIRYYPLIAMRDLGQLTEQQCADLRSLSTRATNYRAVAEQQKQQGSLF